MPGEIEDAKKHKMPASAPPRKGSSSPGWVRTAKFVAVMATIAVLLGATDLPGSGSVKRLAAATGLAMYAEDPGVPFPRPERRSLFAQKSSNLKLPDPIRTNERPKLTPEEEKRRKEVIKIYEDAKAEAAKEQERKLARDAANTKRVEAERARQAALKAARKELPDKRSKSSSDASADSKDSDSKRADSRDEADSSKKDANGQKSSSDKSAAEAEETTAKKDTA